jgi:hypothetical protein
MLREYGIVATHFMQSNEARKNALTKNDADITLQVTLRANDNG